MMGKFTTRPIQKRSRKNFTCSACGEIRVEKGQVYYSVRHCDGERVSSVTMCPRCILAYEFRMKATGSTSVNVGQFSWSRLSNPFRKAFKELCSMYETTSDESEKIRKENEWMRKNGLVSVSVIKDRNSELSLRKSNRTMRRVMKDSSSELSRLMDSLRMARMRYKVSRSDEDYGEMVKVEEDIRNVISVIEASRA